MNEIRATAGKEQPRRIERIVVALDASPHSLAALRAATELAALLDAAVEGLFVEDINLLHLCGFGFCQEIGSYTARPRRIEGISIERQLRVLAANMERAMDQMMAQHMIQHTTTIPWSFHVRRGVVVNELLRAAEDAALVGLGRTGQVRRKSLGSNARALLQQSRRPLLLLDATGGVAFPLTTVYAGSPASQRTLQLATRLARHSEQPVRVLLWTGGQPTHSAAELQAEAEAILGNMPVRFIRVRWDILTAVHAHNGGTLILPGDLAALVDMHQGPTILVP